MLALALAAGCAMPSNHRDWSPELAVLPYAERLGNQVKVHNVRNCSYISEDQFVVKHYDRTYDLDRLRTVDFFVVPFAGMPSLAHTMLSFGFDDDEYLAVSVEVRKQKGQTYQLVKGMLHEYELMYVVGDERDLIKLRTEYRKVDVYLYRSTATPEKAQELFVDVFDRVNKLSSQPEFYDTLSNNCTTNIAQHINHLAPNKIPFDYRVLLPGYSDRLAYDLGLIEHYGTFEETRQRAHINALAMAYRDDADFSAKIRR
jgi:hypothetical protein